MLNATFGTRFDRVPIYVHIHVCIPIYVHIHVCIPTYVHIHVTYIGIPVYTYSACILYTHIQYVYIHIAHAYCMRIYISLYIHLRVYTCVYTIRIYTYTRIYIYVYIQVSNLTEVNLKLERAVAYKEQQRLQVFFFVRFFPLGLGDVRICISSV